MPSSQLSEVLKGGSANKVAIGYSVRGYENILTTMGSIYGNNTGSLSRKVVYVDNNPNQPQEPQSSGLGSVSITDEKAVNGFYSQYELAAVEIHPITAFPYNDDGNNYSVVTFNQTVGQDGAIYDGTKKSVPEVFDKASIDACAQDNAGDFIVGAGLGIGGEFGEKYVDNFYNGQLTKDDICKLCKDGVLYAEIFFPSQTTADIMIARVIYDTDGSTKVSGDLTFWNCYIPAPILALDGYNSYFELMAGNSVIQQPSYGSNAIYSYVNATIQGFSPSVVSSQIQTNNPTSMTATITKWPGMAEDAQGYAVAYARVRLVVPPDMASQAESSIGKKLPERLTALTDSTIATGIAQSAVVGGDSTLAATASDGTYWYDQNELGQYISYDAWGKAFRVIFGFEVGTTIPSWDDVTAGNGKGGNGENFVSWGPTQLTKETLYGFLTKIVKVPDGDAKRLSGSGLSDATIKQYFQEINNLVKQNCGTNVMNPVLEYWWSMKKSIVKSLWTNCGFSKTNLGFAMCLYMANQGFTIISGVKKIGDFRGIIGGVSGDIEKCKKLATEWRTSNGNWVKVKQFWTEVSNSGDIQFTGTYSMSKFGKKGVI